MTRYYAALFFQSYYRCCNLFDRWNKQKGDDVGKRFSKWNTGEPNLADFIDSERFYSPVTQLAFDRCGNNPTFSCCTSSSGCSFGAAASQSESTCSNLLQSSGSFSQGNSGSNSGSGRASQFFLSSGSSKTKPSCTEGDDGKRRCTVDSNDSIFINIEQVKELTGTSKAACMALLGPNIDTTSQTQNTACSTVTGTGSVTNDYDPTQPMFNLCENSILNNGYKRWIDVDCGRKTKSLMCEMIGIKLIF